MSYRTFYSGQLLQMGTAFSEVTCPRGTGCSGVKCPRTTYSGVNGLGGHFTSRTVSSVTHPTHDGANACGVYSYSGAVMLPVLITINNLYLQ